eukprot:c15639_g1_i1 orf=253-1122(+)
MGQTCCCMQINHSKVGIKERWGKFDEVLEPGVYCINWCTGKFDEVLEPGVYCINWCTGKKVKKIINLRLQQVDVKCHTKTKDNIFLIVATSVQYRVNPRMANQAFYKLSDPRVQIRSFILDIITSTVPKIDMKDLYQTKDEISKTVATYVEKEMSLYGLDIVKALIVEIFLDESVNQSLNFIKSTNVNRNVEQGTGEEVLNKLSNSLDAIVQHFMAKDTMQQRLLDIEERNAQLLERQVTLEKEQLQVAKESLTLITQVEKEKNESFVGALNTLASSIAGSNINLGPVY